MLESKTWIGFTVFSWHFCCCCLSSSMKFLNLMKWSKTCRLSPFFFSWWSKLGQILEAIKSEPFVGFWDRLSVNCKKRGLCGQKTIQLHHKMNEFIQKISSLANFIVSFFFQRQKHYATNNFWAFHVLLLEVFSLVQFAMHRGDTWNSVSLWEKVY